MPASLEQVDQKVKVPGTSIEARPTDALLRCGHNQDSYGRVQHAATRRIA